MRAPRTYDDLRESISRRYAELPGRLRQIAEFALHNPNDMAFATVAEIAERAGVQPSSIIRFANSFGFPGFSDMQTLFRTRLVSGSPSYRERIAALRTARPQSNGRNSGPSALLSRFVSDGIASLEHLQETVRASEIDKAVRTLTRANDIYIVAQGRSFPVAFYLHYALNRLDRRSHLVDGVGGVARDQARLIGRDDALIAVSFKDYARDVVAIVDDCRARDVAIIAITDSPVSPIARDAAACFEAEDDMSQPFRSLVAPICLAQTLVVAYGQQLEAKARSA
ncbi:MAG TPA: MurR/RpiR family transcriptional regulator [Alphaproteobacteria bacterium]|nr:MurR/RpiR family transcriptional regulator [Alphaproteobacteria bacterium]